MIALSAGMVGDELIRIGQAQYACGTALIVVHRLRPARAFFDGIGERQSHRPNPSDLRSAGDAVKDRFTSESSSLRKPPLPPAPLADAADGVFPTERNAR